MTYERDLIQAKTEENKRLRVDNIRLDNMLTEYGKSILNLTDSLGVLRILVDNVRREYSALEKRLVLLEQAELDRICKNKRIADNIDKFEAGYYQKIEETP